MDIFFQMLSGIVIAGLSSLFTVNLSLRKFRTEKWWEKKAETYTNLLGIIHDAKAFSEENLEAYSKGVGLTDEEDQELREKSKKAEAEIYRAMDVGSFYLCKDAIECLRNYKKDASQAGDVDGSWGGYLADDFNAANRCLKAMIAIAKRDLQIK